MNIRACSDEMTKQLIMTMALLIIMVRPSFGQSADTDDRLQLLIASLRTCIHSNASAAYAAGIRTEPEAIAFFVARCNATILDELAKARDLVIPPGRFRIVIQQEWTAFTAGSDGK